MASKLKISPEIMAEARKIAEGRNATVAQAIGTLLDEAKTAQDNALKGAAVVGVGIDKLWTVLARIVDKTKAESLSAESVKVAVEQKLGDVGKAASTATIRQYRTRFNRALVLVTSGDRFMDAVVAVNVERSEASNGKTVPMDATKLEGISYNALSAVISKDNALTADEDVVAIRKATEAFGKLVTLARVGRKASKATDTKAAVEASAPATTEAILDAIKEACAWVQTAIDDANSAKVDVATESEPEATDDERGVKAAA